MQARPEATPAVTDAALLPVRRPAPRDRFSLRGLGIWPRLRLLAWGAGTAAERTAARAMVVLPARARAAAREARERREARRLAAVLGDLKGPYAKLGQFASLRYDVLTPALRAELAGLRDRVRPLPLRAVRRVVEGELGCPLEEAFAAFDPRPLGAASVAQAHRATLRDGTAVVVKVQYPWLGASLAGDLRLLRGLLGRATRSRGRGGAVDPDRLFDEFARGLREELDFRHEARVAREIAANLEGDPGVVVPRVVTSHSAERVLTVEHHAAVPIADAGALRRLRVDPAEVLEILARAYAKQVFVDGLFHADPHPGNLFVLEDTSSGPRVLFVDFGLSRRLPAALRAEMRTAILAMLQGDVAGFLAGMERLGMVAPGAREAVGVAVQGMFERLRSEAPSPLQLGPGRVLALKDEAKALLEETPGIQLPNDLLLYAKTLSYLFALGEELAPEVDLMKLTVPWLLRFLAERDGPAVTRGAGAADPGGG